MGRAGIIGKVFPLCYKTISDRINWSEIPYRKDPFSNKKTRALLAHRKPAALAFRSLSSRGGPQAGPDPFTLHQEQSTPYGGRWRTVTCCPVILLCWVQKYRHGLPVGVGPMVK